MPEAEPGRVQPLPAEAQPGGQRRIGAVGQVPDQRVPDRGQVHPDLVGAAGLQLDVEQAGRPERLQGVVVGDARPAATANFQSWPGCRSIGASMVPRLGSGWPCTSAAYRLSTVRVRKASLSTV